jgi:hypothetical protein
MSGDVVREASMHSVAQSVQAARADDDQSGTDLVGQLSRHAKW